MIKLRSHEEIEKIPVQDIIKFAKDNWYWIYPLFQSGYELAVKTYQRWKKKRNERNTPSK